MHELLLMEEVCAAAASACAGERVHVVRLLVGRESDASRCTLRTCFEICATGTPLDGARLDIVETEGSELWLDAIEVG